jgi:tRNA threonylcarbamoyl adenosine modification protein (Sua5/YciO/YrdC/YwlC family)
VYPTDTLYGLGADALSPTAVLRVFEAKQRPQAQPLSVAVADLPMMEQVVRVTPLARRLVDKFLPGPLTLVLFPDPGTPDELRGEARGLGVRIPEHADALELCRRFGPITCTSANLHGQPDPSTCAEARRQLGSSVACYLDAGPLPGQASTVLDLTGSAPRLVREGALPAKELQPWLSMSTNA